MSDALPFLLGGLGLVIGAVVGYLGYRAAAAGRMVAAQQASSEILIEAEGKSREILLAAKDEALELRNQTDKEISRRRRELDQEVEQLNQRREKLDHRVDQVENRARNLDDKDKQLEQRAQRLQELEAERDQELARIAQLSRDEARQELLAKVAESARNDVARIIRDIEQAAREEGEERARDIIITCIQRMASDVVNDVVSSTVVLPSDELKGRIIGRQGRNIRAFEQATGVDVIVDDTPEAVTLSSMDPVRREVARRSIDALIVDGRIHPARIEQIVRKTREDLDKQLVQIGEEAAFEAGVPRLHKELARYLGRLKFRTSYGQNVLNHSIEVAHLAAMLAAEVGADVQLARTGGLLHDIGKGLTHEVEGPHALIGADLAAKYGMPRPVVNAIGAHHHEMEQETLEAVLVEAADAISGARPGARRESLELYIKRIKSLENIAQGFAGVQETYAIQAGREIRILVRPEEVDDLAATELARDIARKVEDTLEYPGQVKVTVIREMRAVDYAK